ncbi:MAG: delta-60 repeat domain-containing protein, partial [Acidimicrobiales bacterium]
SALGTGSQADFVLVGYTASGALDPGFGGAGAVATDFSGDEDSLTALALQPDGRVVAAGYALLAGVGDAIAVARYSAAGQPDPTFAGDGTVTFQVAGPGLARAVAVQANGRIVVAGNNAADGGDFHVARLRADGQLDPDFDGDGRALVDFGSERDQAAAVAVQADGRILVFGTNHTFGLTVGSFALARFEGTAAGPLAGGYRMTAADGGVFTFGNRAFHGSTGDLRLNSPIVGGATDPATADGYWLAAADGGVFSFKAPFLGSAAGQVLDAPVVAIEATPTGLGYWLVTARGRIIAFGDAVFIGDTRALALNQPITRMAATPTGLGYWLLGRDGGVFTFGDATFFGSTGARRLNAPVIDLAPVPDGSGYWLVGSDGGVFTFGAAQFHGSTGDLRLNAPVVAALAAPSGAGYWLAASDGGVFTFGPGMAFHGSLGDRRLNSPVNDFIL